jgi:hypothetical protein
MYDGVIDDLGFDAADVKAQTDGWVQTMKVRNALHFVSRQFRMYKTVVCQDRLGINGCKESPKQGGRFSNRSCKPRLSQPAVGPGHGAPPPIILCNHPD